MKKELLEVSVNEKILKQIIKVKKGKAEEIYDLPKEVWITSDPEENMFYTTHSGGSFPTREVDIVSIWPELIETNLKSDNEIMPSLEKAIADIILEKSRETPSILDMNGIILINNSFYRRKNLYNPDEMDYFENTILKLCKYNLLPPPMPRTMIVLPQATIVMFDLYPTPKTLPESGVKYTKIKKEDLVRTIRVYKDLSRKD